MDALYSGKILDFAADIPEARRLETPDATAFKRSRLCGSEMTVDLNVEDGRVSDFGMIAKACALGQCSASILAQHLIGAAPAELRDIAVQMRAMLKDGGPPPSGEWADLGLLQPVKDYPQRHASTLLAFDAVVDCVDQIEAASAAEA